MLPLGERKVTSSRAVHPTTPRWGSQDAVEALGRPIAGKRPAKRVGKLQARAVDAGQQNPAQPDGVGERVDFDAKDPGALHVGPCSR